MAFVSLRFFKGKKLGTYLVLLSRNGGMLKGSGKQLRRNLPEVEWTTASAFHVFYRFHVKGCYSLTLHALPPISRACHRWIWKSGKHTGKQKTGLVGLTHHGSARHPLGSWHGVWLALWKKKKHEMTRCLKDIRTPWRSSQLTRERRCWLGQAK